MYSILCVFCIRSRFWYGLCATLNDGATYCSDTSSWAKNDQKKRATRHEWEWYVYDGGTLRGHFERRSSEALFTIHKSSMISPLFYFYTCSPPIFNFRVNPRITVAIPCWSVCLDEPLRYSTLLRLLLCLSGSSRLLTGDIPSIIRPNGLSCWLCAQL